VFLNHGVDTTTVTVRVATVCVTTTGRTLEMRTTGAGLRGRSP
jgi:hypothetical protein